MKLFKFKNQFPVYILAILLLVYSIYITYLYAHKISISSAQYKDQAQEIIDTFSSENNGVSIANQIDNFAYGGEHAIPEGGGGWCVYKKVDNKWNRLFCSQDSVWCGLYIKYNLPAGLLGKCEQEPDKKVLNLD
jgi:hypothetical protein